MSIARANTYTKKCYCANNQTMVVGAMLFYRVSLSLCLQLKDRGF